MEKTNKNCPRHVLENKCPPHVWGYNCPGCDELKCAHCWLHYGVVTLYAPNFFADDDEDEKEQLEPMDIVDHNIPKWDREKASEVLARIKAAKEKLLASGEPGFKFIEFTENNGTEEQFSNLSINDE